MKAVSQQSNGFLFCFSPPSALITWVENLHFTCPVLSGQRRWRRSGIKTIEMEHCCVKANCSTWTEQQLWSRQQARVSEYTDKGFRPTFAFNTHTHTQRNTHFTEHLYNILWQVHCKPAFKINWLKDIMHTSHTACTQLENRRMRSI
jgi:hypothetical protein